MDAATIINRASAKRITRRAALASLLTSAAARALPPLGGVQSGGGGSLSTLATLVNSMTAGTWATWTAGVMTSALTNPLNDDPVTSNSSNVSADPAGNIQMFGHGHGNDYQSLMLDFTDSSSTWSNAGATPVGGGSNLFPDHQWAGQAVDFVTGDLYWYSPQGTGAGVAYKRVHGTNSWPSIGGGPSAGHGDLLAATFNPHYGAAGGYYTGSNYGIDVYDVSGAAWHNVWAGSGAGGFHYGGGFPSRPGLAFYDVSVQSVHFVSSTSCTDSQAILRVGPTGTLTQMGSAPAGVNINLSSENQGMLVDGYTSTSTLSGQNTNGTVRKPLLLTPGGAMYRYDSISDVWSVVSGVTNPNSSVANNALCCGFVAKYDCVIQFSQSDSSGTMTASVYKRSVND